MINLDVKLEDIIREKTKRRHSKSLLSFIKENHHDYKSNWFHESVCQQLEQFYDDIIKGKNPRLMLFAPPRSGKSEIVSRYFPAWVFSKNKDLSILGTSYSGSLSGSLCRDVQKILLEEKYIETHGKIVNEKARGREVFNAAGFSIVGHRGQLKSAGVGGGITGFGCDIAIIDDPFRDHSEAYSTVIRDNVWNWYLTTLSTRLSPIGGILIINTRWHYDDLCGRILASEEAPSWKVLSYKAIAEYDEEYRKVGEALHPERYPIEKLLEIREKLGINFFSALYQQEPIAESGGLFSKNMFIFGEVPESWDWSFIIIDTAYKDKQENDYTAMMGVKVRSNVMYVDRIKKKHIKAKDSEKEVLEFYCEFNATKEYGFRGIWIEPKGHGIYLNQTLPLKQVIIPDDTMVEEFFKDRRFDKVQRANNAIPYLVNKVVIINQDIQEKDDHMREILNFPRGKHDDVVDCLIDAIKMVYGKEISIFDALR